MAQLLFSGALFPVKGVAFLEQLSWLAPARWAFAASAADVGVQIQINDPRTGKPLTIAGSNFTTQDGLWDNSGGTVFLDLFMLVVLTALYIAITAILLRRIGQLKLPAHLQAQQGYGQNYQQPRVVPSPATSSRRRATSRSRPATRHPVTNSPAAIHHSPPRPIRATPLRRGRSGQSRTAW